MSVQRYARPSIAFLTICALVGAGSFTPALAEEGPVALVATRNVEPGPYQITLPEKLGRLEAGRERVLAFEVSGRLETVEREGVALEAGVLIASLDTGLEQARIRQATLRVREARSELTRGRGLRESNALSAKGLESAETSLGIAEAELDVAREQLARRRMLAPFAGIVVETFRDPGEVVSPASTVARFMELNPLKLEIGVPEHQINEVAEGVTVLLDLPSLPGEQIVGAVSRVARAVVEGRHLFEVEVRIPNPEGRLRPGMSASARIVTGTLQDAVVIPSEFAVRRNGERVVFFVGEGVARSVSVEDAVLHGDRLVLSSPPIWRELVVRGQRDLYDGVAIEVDNRVLAGLEPTP